MTFVAKEDSAQWQADLAKATTATAHTVEGDLIEVGKTYETRSGEIVEITVVTSGLDFPVFGQLNGTDLSWNVEGAYYTHRWHGFDLMRLAGKSTQKVDAPAAEEPKDFGLKYDQDKPRFDLIDAEMLESLARVLTFGARKYAEENWRKGISFKRLLAAAKRHINAIERLEDNDTETGELHAAHAMCCMMFLGWMQKNRPDMDDRYRKANDPAPCVGYWNLEHLRRKHAQDYATAAYANAAREDLEQDVNDHKTVRQRLLNQLSPGVSVQIYGDAREWVITDKLNPKGDKWRLRSADRAESGYQEMKIIDVSDIAAVIA